MLREQVAELQASGTVEDLLLEVTRLQQRNSALESQTSEEVKGQLLTNTLSRCSTNAALDLLAATYDRETALFEHKKSSANAMRKEAEREYQKLLTKKKGVLSSLRLAHSDVCSFNVSN
jgi:hypothetical protein